MGPGQRRIVQVRSTPLQPSLTPVRITVDQESQEFRITWQDGHVGAFPLDGLRRACPCAGCQGHESMHALPDPAIFRLPALMQWLNVKVEVAGSVGLRLTWDDGHNSGIFTWARLRAMCPCTQCAPLPH